MSAQGRNADGEQGSVSLECKRHLRPLLGGDIVILPAKLW